MLSKLPMFWQVMAVATVVTLSYPISLMLSALMGQDRFGTVTNMTIVSLGFFGTLYACEHYGYALYGLQHMIMVGTAGAIATAFVLSLMRVGIAKL